MNTLLPQRTVTSARVRTGLRAGALVSLLLLGTAVSAAPERGERGLFGEPQRLTRLAHKLELSETQRDQIEERFFKAHREARPHRDSLYETRQQMRDMRRGEFDEQALRGLLRTAAGHREEVAIIYARAMSDMRALLTAEQREQFAKMRERRGRHRRR